MTFEEMLAKNGTLVFTNKGVSMMPLLRQNRDVMVIEATDEFHRLDAVLFKRDNGQYILHRILKIKNGMYYIVGDNCVRGEWIRKDRILGVLTSVKRDEKTIRVTDKRYRLYVRTRPIYRFFIPLRAFLKWCSKIPRRIKRKVFKK